MLGSLERPDVDKITGLNPVIAIEQKTVNRNPRSTIGTTTEIYDFLRLLLRTRRRGRSYISGETMVKYTHEKIVVLHIERYPDRRIYILAPACQNRKGHYKELFESLPQERLPQRQSRRTDARDHLRHETRRATAATPLSL